MAKLKSPGMTVAEAGRLGGAKVASERGRAYYVAIGRKGGERVSRDRTHMAAIGKKGGKIGGARVRDLIERGKAAG